MNLCRTQHRTVCVSFSGIDGAGKSTQIDALQTAAEQAGLHASMIRFWDDIARLTGIRESSSHKIFKGDRGIGSPNRPINRRDKNVRSWSMSCIRLFVYTLDALSTRAAISKARRSGADLIIFDRYLYDELANLNLTNPLMRVYARLMMLLTPRPDISFVLDADPQAARTRKPEYPLEFIYLNRQAYLELSRILGYLTIIPPMSVADVKRTILNHVLEFLALPVFPDFSAGDKSLSRPTA
jgi:thymidylate kinase